jgi:hypothetical protein
MNMNASVVAMAAGSAADPAGSVGFKVDVTRGERVGRVSSEWFSRPDDERYLSLPELYQELPSEIGASFRPPDSKIDERGVRVDQKFYSSAIEAFTQLVR